MGGTRSGHGSRTEAVLGGGGERARRVRDMRQRSPAAPSGLESSREWALSIGVMLAPDAPGSPKFSVGKNNRWSWKTRWLRPGIGYMLTYVAIRDQTSGATGRFVFGGISIGADILPANAEWKSGWKEFRTEGKVSLRSFEQLTRFASLNLLGLDFETLQFTNTDIEHDSWQDAVMLGDGVDISDVTTGSDWLGVSWTAGYMLRYDTYWDDLPDDTVQEMATENLVVTITEAARELDDFLTSCQVEDGDIESALLRFDEALEQQSLPEPGVDPTAEVLHHLDEEEAQQSLLTPEEYQAILEESWLADILAGEGFSEAQADAMEALEHALEELDAAQSLPPIDDAVHQQAEVDGQMSLMTNQQLDDLHEQMADMDAHREAEIREGMSLMREDEAAANDDAGADAEAGSAGAQAGSGGAQPPDAVTGEPKAEDDAAPPTTDRASEEPGEPRESEEAESTEPRQEENDAGPVDQGTAETCDAPAPGEEATYGESTEAEYPTSTGNDNLADAGASMSPDAGPPAEEAAVDDDGGGADAGGGP